MSLKIEMADYLRQFLTDAQGIIEKRDISSLDHL